jgi:hypothetical protein
VLIDWREAKYRRWGTAEVPQFGPATPGAPRHEPAAWLAALVRQLHDAPQGSSPVLVALRQGEVAFALRVVETAQDGTGRADEATNVRFWRAPTPAAGSERLCQALLAWLLRSRELLLDDADPQGLLAACVAPAALEAARASALPAGLDWLVRLDGRAPVRGALPAAEGDIGARQALVRRLRLALLAGGERLEPVIVAGFAASPAIEPPLLWLAPGDEPALDPRAGRLAERLARVWTRPLADLGREVQASLEPPLAALDGALALAEALGPALTEERGLWRFDARAAERALQALPAGERESVRASAAPRLRAALDARQPGAWSFEAGAGLVLHAPSGRPAAVLALAKGDERAGLAAHQQWLGGFDAAQLEALLRQAPVSALLDVLPPGLLEWPARTLAWAAQHQPGELIARWRTLDDPARQADTARHVVAGVGEQRHVLPLDLLLAAGALPAEAAPLGRIVGLLGARAPLASLAPAEIDAEILFGLASTVLARCPEDERPEWRRFFARRARELKRPAALDPALAGDLYEALPEHEREAALRALLRCAPGEPRLARAALRAFLRGGAGREHWEDALPAPTAELLVDALRLPIGAPPAQQPQPRDARARFWRYVALRARLPGAIPLAQARELILSGDGPLWRAATAWTLAQGRDELLLDLWSFAPAGTLREVDPPAALGRLLAQAVERGAQPADHGPAWDAARATLRLFVVARDWSAELKRAPLEALRRLAREDDVLAAAREVGWDAYLRQPGADLAAVWRAAAREPELRRVLLRSLSWPARLRLAEASQGQLGLDDILAVPEV